VSGGALKAPPARSSAEIKFGTFYPQNRTSGGNKFKDFPENQMTKFHAEFPKFMQNLVV